MKKLKLLFQKKFSSLFAICLCLCVVAGAETSDFVKRKLVEGKVSNFFNAVAARSGSDVIVRINECRAFTRLDQQVCDITFSGDGDDEDFIFPITNKALDAFANAK